MIFIQLVRVRLFLLLSKSSLVLTSEVTQQDSLEKKQFISEEKSAEAKASDRFEKNRRFLPAPENIVFGRYRPTYRRNMPKSFKQNEIDSSYKEGLAEYIRKEQDKEAKEARDKKDTEIREFLQSLRKKLVSVHGLTGQEVNRFQQNNLCDEHSVSSEKCCDYLCVRYLLVLNESR